MFDTCQECYNWDNPDIVLVSDDVEEAELIHFNTVQSYINGDSIKLVH